MGAGRGPAVCATRGAMTNWVWDCTHMLKLLLASQYRATIARYRALLQNWGIRILTTTSGYEAIRLHAEQQVDLIFSDYLLEDMSGPTLCTLIRHEERERPLPIVIACQNIGRRIVRSWQCGASAVLVKPLNRLQLLGAIGEQTGLNLIRGRRVGLLVLVTVKRAGKQLICFSRDISRTGMLLKSDFELNPGERIRCRFNLPDTGPVTLEGEVVRYRTDLLCDNLYGIRFVTLEEGGQTAIDLFLIAAADESWGFRGRGNRYG